jgi:glycosyltransferase involved in cell wall biosynthesis
MKIPVIGIPVVNRGDLLLRCVRSIDLPVEKIIIVNNGADPGVKEAIAMLEREMPNVVTWQFGWNAGVSKAWNGIIQSNPAPYWIIVGNDIAFSPGDLAKMVEAIQTHDVVLSRDAYSCFAITKKALNAVGKFDENFHPAYFEDNDFDYRVKLAGVSRAYAETNLIHGDGPANQPSGTVRSDPVLRQHNDRTFSANRNYFVNKWGGMPGEEKFTKPFNHESGNIRDWWIDEERVKANDWNIGNPPKKAPWLFALMPSMRWQNWPRIRANWQAALDRGANINVQLCLVMWPEQWAGVPESHRAVLDAPWIRLMLVDKVEGDAYYMKLNSAADLLSRNDEDYGWIWHPCDDSMVPRTLFKNLEEPMWRREGVIVFSAKRGQRPAKTPHGASTLVAAPENMCVGSVTGEQYFVHMSEWCPFENSCVADGLMGEKLSKQKRCNYYPEHFILFNALEEGRWDREELAKALEIQ